MKNKLIFFTLLYIFVTSYSYSDINFYPKSLSKYLQKNNGQNLTEIQIQNSTIIPQTHLGKYFTFTSDSTIKYVYIGRSNACRSTGCSINTKANKEETFEYFDYFIIFDTQKKVEFVYVYNYQASHGQEITATGWLKQFIGYSGEQQLEVGKQIDGISGATTSVYSITQDIELKTKLLQQITK